MMMILIVGDWGLGIGDWGLGPIPNPQSPIPNPQSPIPILLFYNDDIIIIIKVFKLQYYFLINNYSVYINFELFNNS